MGTYGNGTWFENYSIDIAVRIDGLIINIEVKAVLRLEQRRNRCNGASGWS